jgi:hypothetical protein
MHTDQDTDGVPISVLDCGTSVTVVAPIETVADLSHEWNAKLRRLRLEAEAQAGAQ